MFYFISIMETALMAIRPKSAELTRLHTQVKEIVMVSCI